MAEPFLGEIRIWGFDWAPRGWSRCDGQLLAIASYSALYSLLGTTFGGDGRTTFGLPELRSRTPMHQGNGVAMGMRAGVEEVTLTVSEIPAHTHEMRASPDPAAQSTPIQHTFATFTGDKAMYSQQPPTGTMSARTTGAGAGFPHTNLQPTLVTNFTIAMVGLFPSRN